MVARLSSRIVVAVATDDLQVEAGVLPSASALPLRPDGSPWDFERGDRVRTTWPAPLESEILGTVARRAIRMGLGYGAGWFAEYEVEHLGPGGTVRRVWVPEGDLEDAALRGTRAAAAFQALLERVARQTQEGDT